MRVLRQLVLCFLLVVVSAACASTRIVPNAEIPAGSEIVVIPFRDCLISGQDEDCNGSGMKTAEAFVEVFGTGKFTSRLAMRPIGPKEVLTDAAAVEFARQNGYQYVINGEVDDFYSVAPMTFRTDRAAVSVRVLRVSDGLEVLQFSRPGVASSNFETPQGMMKALATQLRNVL